MFVNFQCGIWLPKHCCILSIFHYQMLKTCIYNCKRRWKFMPLQKELHWETTSKLGVNEQYSSTSIFVNTFVNWKFSILLIYNIALGKFYVNMGLLFGIVGLKQRSDQTNPSCLPSAYIPKLYVHHTTKRGGQGKRGKHFFSDCPRNPLFLLWPSRLKGSPKNQWNWRDNMLNSFRL